MPKELGERDVLLRVVRLIAVCAFAAGCSVPASQTVGTAVQAPGGPVPANFSLCDLKPAPSACDVPATELTARTALERIDTEFARLQKAAPTAAREFAVDCFSAAELRAGTPEYARLRNRAWQAAFEASEEFGQRYFMLRDIGRAAFRSGDREMTRETIEQRRILIRRRRDDQEWEEWTGGDVIYSLPREEASRRTAFDAARFGDGDLAIAVLNEAVPASRRKSFDYLSDVAAIRLEAGQNEQAEALARRIIETAPYRFREMREMYEDEKVRGHTILIISLLKQGKKIDGLADRLFYHVRSLPTSLSGHAENFFAASNELAEASPKIARRFLKLGQDIHRIGAGAAEFHNRYLEVEACKALRDDACLLKLAKANEREISPGSPHYFWAIAMPYAVAGDFASVKRLFQSVKPERCDPQIYPAIAERLRRNNELSAVSGWLRDWVVCQLGHKPNYKHWTGLTGNFWSGIAKAYAEYSVWQFEAGLYKAALNSARMALLLAIETERTWTFDSEYYRARNFARAYGSALGALARAEAAVSTVH